MPESGYKIFRVDRKGRLLPLYFSDGTTLREGEWLEERHYRIGSWRNGLRPDAAACCGWYILPTLREAAIWLAALPKHARVVVRLVDFRNVIGEEQDLLPDRSGGAAICIPIIRVAEMRILPLANG